MQEQNKLASAGRKPASTPTNSAFGIAAVERGVQVIASRSTKPGSSTSSYPAQQLNRSSLQAGVAAASAPAPSAPSNPILKCPRCNSLNTKFCYYNNYSLLQPRHFCKNCRRYWTKGGALRNVPVGGGCRKNKRANSTAPTSNSTAMMAMPASAASRTAQQGSMNMMIRENTATSCRNNSLATAPMITSPVQKAALQESCMPPQLHTHFSPLYNYNNPASSFYNAADHSNLAQHPLLISHRLAPFLPPNQAASFHSFLNLKQALSSLASSNHTLHSFNASLAPAAALPFLSDEHISTANLDAALQPPIDDTLMGLDPINASTPASVVPLPSLSNEYSTTTSLFFNNSSSSLTSQQGFRHPNNRSNSAVDHQLRCTGPISTDQKMNPLFKNDQQDVFRSSTSSRSACKGLEELHAAAVQQELNGPSSKGLQDMQQTAAVLDQQEQLDMQLMSRSSCLKNELVSGSFKIKGDGNDQGDTHPAAGAACCTNAGWADHGAHRSSFLEASGDEQPYWSCNPSTWHDDLSS